MRRAVILLTLGVILAAVNLSIYRHEQILRHGREILLRLAPVDPRSLMQGDYMRLRFELARKIQDALLRDRLPHTSGSGLVQVNVTPEGIARFQRLCGDKAPCDADAVILRYTLRRGRVRLGTDAFFFPEGEAKKYEVARYGVFRVGEDGEMILTGLR